MRVAEPGQDEGASKAHGQPGRDAACRQQHEAARRVHPTERPCHGGGHRKAEQHDPRGVVDQALALQQHHDPAGQPQPGQHRLGRHRVRWGHDGAQREACRPGQPGHDQVRHDTHDQRRECHRAHRKLHDDPQVGAEVPPSRVVRAGHQQRRQEQHQHQVRVQRDPRRTRHQGKGAAAQHEGSRGRQVQAPGQQLQDDDGGQEQQHQLEQGDRGHGVPPSARVWS